MFKQLKGLSLTASLAMLSGLIITASAAAGESGREFRLQIGLVAYAPPAGFGSQDQIAHIKGGMNHVMQLG
jgi:hypothetical protein